MTTAHIAQAEAFMRSYTGDDTSTGPCQACGRVWPMLVLDAKPGPDGVNFTRLEGPCCYGDGYETP